MPYRWRRVVIDLAHHTGTSLDAALELPVSELLIWHDELGAMLAEVAEHRRSR